jgi:hypothetical protein
LYMWPYSRTAVLIPLTWWSMYLVNKWRVSRPVFGLIDEIAERAGFYPVYSKKPETPAPTAQPAPAMPPPAREPETSLAPAPAAAASMPIAAVAK